MRNDGLIHLRTQLKGSRFLFPKATLLRFALGRDETDELRPNLCQIPPLTRGLPKKILLFTNDTFKHVQSILTKTRLPQFPKAGTEATQDVILQEDGVSHFSHELEPQLRKNGLPTRLDNGIIKLRYEHTVCTKGQELRPEQAQIIKLLGIPMCYFTVEAIAVWDSETTKVKMLRDDMDE
eukprot:CAMPEP_0168514136 /NCGR_PEP_ID=MMETSP0405-20121227/3919_1 /TAXON_ID=498012 /ORGANISM="Trichosphaerium sp, Strain Am-I-7 wt" /LENGTH=179 /DNA_ID=CAMNT_0008533183 /DNA_START=96 /DNA_END=635 /DNA_ORIENTATION=-